jgi:hydrogenase expression/formation protein HypC
MMCLGIPGRIIEVFRGENPLDTSALIDFSGAMRRISLAAVPDASVGEYVVVHAGMALNRLKPEEADLVFSYLKEMAALESTDN